MVRLIPRVMCGMAALSLCLAAHAAAVLESATGDVRVTQQGKKPAAARPGQRIATASIVVTGSDGLAILKFDDDQRIAVAPNSELAIVDYHYNLKIASADRSELALNRGAARIVTGQIARRNYEMFVLRTPHVNLGVRGTDFSVTIVGQSYWSVNDGAVAASTNVGTGVYGAGSFGRSQALDRLAAGLSSAGLPVAVLALFNELGSPQLTAQLGAGARAAGAAQAAQAAPESTGAGVGTLGLLAAIVAALAAAGGGGGGGNAAAPSH